jgi:flagellar assembly factor FliW
MLAMSLAYRDNTALAFDPMESEIVATIKNRFGTFDFTEDQMLTLRPGLIGFPEYHRFALAPLTQMGMTPLQGGHNFRLLQSLDEPNLCFIVFPTTASNSLLETIDTAALCEEHGMRRDDLILLHIATIREGENGKAEMTLNLKAPIVINAYRRTGSQQVLASNKYSIQHAVSAQRQAA